VDLAGFAGAVRGVADRAEASLANDCARTAAREFLGALQVTTPVLTGALRESEHVSGVTGGGAVATAIVGSDLIYAHFRNFGGTITKKSPGSLGTPAAGFFGHSVTQAGSHYMERAQAEAIGPIQAACRAYLDEFLVI
jgi:hypothetical protein